MSPSYQFPELFGVVRIQPYRPPSLQFCTARASSRVHSRFFQPSELDSYTIENLPPEEFPLIEPSAYVSLQFLDQQIRTLPYSHPGLHEIQKVLYWQLPIRVYNRETDQPIPILEFQFRSWLPRGHEPFPLNVNMADSEVRRLLMEVNQDRLTRIRMNEDSQSIRHRGLDLYGFFGRHFGPDDHDDRLTSSQEGMIGAGAGAGHRTPPRRQHRHRSPPPSVLAVREEPEIRVMEVRVPVERVVIQRQAPSLPTPVGQVLLEHARKGNEVCPIASTPFSECESLSVTSCFHIFDTESLQRWRESHRSCPVCRSEVANVVSEEAR